MVLDGLRGYLQLASGLTDVTRERAAAVARSLVAQGEASVGAVVPDSVKAQVSSLTDDLLATSRANRNLLLHVVGGEVERTVTRLGLVSAQDLTTAGRRLDRVERRVTDLEAQVVGPAPTKKATKKAAKKAAKKTTAKKTTKSAARTQPSPVRPPGSGPAPTPAPTPAPPPVPPSDPPATSAAGGTGA
ncbi:MAG TPA: polyhydroxyalkanoate synthesis protein PhaF [Actinomycetes bacterium]|jgi:polyhydroxyalkanoate synthesis regulator phasin|nr:polyhydroxyalkanoate synthesis protein PhaF [Actinomycetes bacterium]